MTGDRDLLEALFAQQLGFAPASELMAAGAEWLVQRDRGLSLKDVLLARGVIDAARAKLIAALVDEAVAAHGGSAADTLTSLPPLARTSLAGLDATLRPGVTREVAGAPLDALTGTSSLDSLETPENIGAEAKGRYSFDTGRKGRTEELGRGGAGRVIVARDHFLGRDVALKELHREITQNVDYDTLHVRNLEARFLREARVTGQLEHPAVVPVYELGRRRDGTLYYTMRRVRGRTLAQALADTSSLEGRLAFVPDLMTACRAVAAAHHRGVIHRDLKPQNVMLGPHGETYVMDWGLARVMGRADRKKSNVQLAPDLTGGRDLGPVGTPSYMSPEQAEGVRDDIDERTDVWGLGAMLFEILTGRAPYVGRSPWDVLAALRTSPPPRVASLEPGAPPELVAVCERALAHGRDGRYANAGELARELELWLTGQRVSAYEYSLREVTRRVLKRHKAKALLAAATALSLAVLAGVATWGIGRERDEARSMARFFLADVAPNLSNAPGTSEVIEQLSSSALEAFAAEVDPETGRRDDRLLLARAWNDLAHQSWRLGRHEASAAALDAAARMLGPLARQHPGDVEVASAQLLHDVWRSDLDFDDGREAEALAALERTRAHGEALRARAPAAPEPLEALGLVLDRLSVVRFNRGEVAAAVELGRRARELALEHYRVAPDDARAAVAVVTAAANLGQMLVGAGQRPEALATLRGALAQVEALRSRADTPTLKQVHGSVLGSLARLLDPRTAAAERGRLLKEARRLFEEVQTSDPGKNYVLLELTELALLDDEPELAWGYAERLEARELGAEYESGVVAAAFATGRDEVVRGKVLAPAPGSEASAVFTAALVEALAGNAPAARRHLARCRELKCTDTVGWFARAVERRAGSQRGPVPELLRALAQEHPASDGEGAALAAAFERLDALLSEAAP